MKKDLLLRVVALLFLGGVGFFGYVQYVERLDDIEVVEKVLVEEEVNVGDHEAAAVQSENVQVDAPLANATISSPLSISGTSSGWYFEGVFPIELLDANNVVIAETLAAAQGDWMTASPVPFLAVMSFSPQPAGSAGMLILRADNPSGLPQYDESYVIPVTF